MNWTPKWKQAGTLAIGVTWLLSGCQLLFGDFKFEPAQTVSSTGGGGGFAGGAEKPGECSQNGTFRCSGAMLEVCENKAWTQQANCDSAERCDAGNGRCMSCVPYTFRCSASMLEQCDDTGQNWYRKDTCPNEAYCDAPNGRCAPCQQDEAFCIGAQLHVCNDGRTDWEVTSCDNPDLCSTSSRTCRPCNPDKEYQCNQNKLQRCNAQAQWVEADTCGSSDLCNDSLNTKALVEAKGETWSGQCNPPLCSAGAFRCDTNNPAQIQSCPPSRNRWENVGTPCYTAQLCNATTGKCNSGCQPGVYRCDGAQLMQCSSTGTSSNLITTCPSAAQCNVANKTCMDCVVGTYQCADTKLQRCNTDQTWQTVSVCTTNELCGQSLAKSRTTCDAPGCSPANSYQCGGAEKKTLQYCPPSQLGWTVVAECATPGLCENGRNTCVEPVCKAAGEHRCPAGSNTYEVCDQDRKNWLVEATCGSSQICVVDKGCQGQCPVPNPTCNGGKQIQICSVDPTTQLPRWVQGTTCPSAALCVDGSTQCAVAVCKAGEFDCRSADGKTSGGSSLFKCSSGLDKWEFVKTCSTGQICDKNGGQCDICVAGTSSCSGKVLAQCSSDGQSNPKTDCLKDTYCHSGTNATDGYCYVCDAGGTQCSGTDQVQSCAADRRSWASPSDCTAGYGCHVTSNKADYCNACATAGEVRCVDSGGKSVATHACASDQKGWLADAPCTDGFGCVKSTDSSNDYCAVCATGGEVQCVDQSAPGSTRACTTDRRGWSDTLDCPERHGCVSVASSDDYCASSCVASSIECVGDTGVHQCKPDGSGWDPTQYECFDEKNLKGCSSGVFTGSVACGESTPYCTSGTCVQCTGAANQCPTELPACYKGQCSLCNDTTPNSCVVIDGRDARQYCFNGIFSNQICDGDCVSAACVPCADSSNWTCNPHGANQRRQCASGRWTFESCAGSTPYCSGGNCVECLDGTHCSGGAQCQSGICVTPPVDAGGEGGGSSAVDGG